MRLPGRLAGTDSIRSGTLTATATSFQISAPCLAPVLRWSHWRRSFHQDLNGDGVIGFRRTVIESAGATSLTEIGNHFYLYDSTGAGPSMKIGGVDYVEVNLVLGRPIGAEQTASGYEVAWRLAGTTTYTVWNTDSNGNGLSNIGAVSGTSATLEVTGDEFPPGSQWRRRDRCRWDGVGRTPRWSDAHRQRRHHDPDRRTE